MEYTVPQASIICMGITCFGCFAIPIILFLILKKKGADTKPFVTGAVVFLLFVIALEGAAVRAVLGSPAGETIQSNIWYYAIFGGLMAGIFEELGRFIAFRTILTNNQNKDINSIMYGVGHGGIEAMVIVGSAMISNIMAATMVNKGDISALTQGLEGDQLAQVQTQLQQLATLPASTFLMSLWERASAIILHMALSVITWFAAKKGPALLVISIFIHAAVDAVTIILSRSGASTLSLEIMVTALSLASVFYARVIWKKYASKPALK